MARLRTEVSGLLCWNCGHHYDENKFRLCPDCGVDPKYDLDEEEEFNDTNDYDDVDEEPEEDVPFEDEHEEIDDDDTF